MKIIHFFALILLLIGCGQKNSTENTETNTTEIEQTETLESEIISEPKFSGNEIAKFTIVTIMDQKPQIINVKEKEGIYIVSYKQPEDGKKYEYKIKINGNRIVWGNADGRWRDTSYDEKLTYRENNDKLIIIQTFSDGSKSEKEFSEVE